MNNYIFLSLLLLCNLVVSCGPTARSGDVITVQQDNDKPIESTTVDTNYSCEYYGYDTSLNGICINNGSIENLSDLRNKNNLWKSALAYMQLAEGNAYLNTLGRDYSGSGTRISLLGSGVNQVANELNISAASKNYGYLNTDSNKIGEIYYDILNPRPNNVDQYHSKLSWYDYQLNSLIDYNDYQKVANICNAGDTELCQTELYSLYNYYYKDIDDVVLDQLIDQDRLIFGYNDVANGTNLASVMVKDSSGNMMGVASGAELVSVKTQFIYNKSIYQYKKSNTNPVASYNYKLGSDDITYDNWVLEDNTGKILYEAVDYAANNSDIILFNNHDRVSDYTHEYFYKQSNSYVYGGNRSWSRSYDQNNEYMNKVKDILDDKDKIFVTPVANILLADLITDGVATGGRDYSTFFAVADANINNYFYCDSNNLDTENCKKYVDSSRNDGKDKYEQNILSSVTLTGFKNDFDCQNFAQDKCLIAPTAINALGKNGDYSLVDANEYTGSAYVAAIIAKIRSAYTEEELTDEDIIKKIFASTIDPSVISGCDLTNNNCGAGMINFYQTVRNINEGKISIQANGSAFSLSESSLSLSPIYGDGFASNAASLLGKAVFFDDYNFTYNAGLEDKISNNFNNSLSIYSLITEPEYNVLGDNIKFKDISYNVTTAEKNNIKQKYLVKGDYEKEVEVDINNFNFHHKLNSKLDFDLSLASNYNYKLKNKFDNITTSKGFTSLHKEQSNVLATKLELNKSLTLDNVILSSDDAISNITNLTLSKNNNILGLSLGLIKEKSTILGAKTSGAFGNELSADTKFVTLQTLHNIGDIELFGSLSLGDSKVNNQESIFSNFSNFKTSELQISASKNLQNMKLGFNYTEPLRVKSGEATITVATARDVEDNVYYEDSKISFATIGKERNYEFFLNYDLEKNTKLKLNILHIQDYGHVKNNKNSLVALNLKKLF